RSARRIVRLRSCSSQFSGRPRGGAFLRAAPRAAAKRAVMECATMSVWDWVIEFNAEAEARGDRDRQRLLPIFENASKFAKTDPDVMLGLLAEGRALAQQLDETWWVLFFDHWRLQALLHFKYDYRDVMDAAVQATPEARQPQAVAL